MTAIDMENDAWARVVFALERIANSLEAIRMIKEHEFDLFEEDL